MTLDKFFRENPAVEAVALDWLGRPVGLRGIQPSGARPSFRCCGDPQWEWIQVESVMLLHFGYPGIPEGFPQSPDPKQSLTYNQYSEYGEAYYARQSKSRIG